MSSRVVMLAHDRRMWYTASEPADSKNTALMIMHTSDDGDLLMASAAASVLLSESKCCSHNNEPNNGSYILSYR